MARKHVCKFCKMPIEKGAKICPYCRKKQRHPILTILCILIILITVVLVAAILSDGQTADPSPSDTSEPIKATAAPDSVDSIIWQDDLVDVHFLGFSNHPELSMFTVDLRVVNKTDKAIWVYMDNASVNKDTMQMIMTGLPLYINPDQQGSTGFIYYLTQTSLTSFEDVEKVAFRLHVADKESLNDMETTEQIEITK